MNWLLRLDRHGRLWFGAVGCLLFLTMTAGDYLTGPEFESSIFYLIPVSFFGWFIGKRAGVTTAAASAFVTLGVHAAFAVYRNPSVIYWNAAAWFTVYAFFAVMLGELRALYEREHRSSRIDPLTRAFNRRAFLEVLEVETRRARRYGFPLTLAYLDVDHFKGINDRYGHAAGDELLATVAQTMQSNVRAADVVARLGGDEFAVLLPETNGDSAAAVLGKLHASLDDAVGERGWGVTFSMGAITFPTPPESVHQMIREADEAMYEAKANGRDQVVRRRTG